MVDDDLCKILNPHTPLKNYRNVYQQKRIFQNQFHHLQRIHLISQDLRGRESLDSNLSYTNHHQPTVKRGDIIFFSSHLLHGVSSHENDEIRKTLSVNFKLKKYNE